MLVLSTIIKHILLTLINLTPLIPLSFSRRGGKNFREGAEPHLKYPSTRESLREASPL